MRRFKVTVEYDGTDFAGFQFQPEQRTVQSVAEDAVAALTRQTARVCGAGRTDAGVHALGQVIGFTVETRIPVDRMTLALNSVLPADIRAVDAEEVDERFHARFSAQSRRYVYAVLNRRDPSALLGRFTHHVPHALDVEAMRLAASEIVGTADMSAWANTLTEARSTVRTVFRCGVRRRGDCVLFGIEANAFLHAMVRNIVGTLIEVGLGRRDPADIGAITRSKDRSRAGQTAPSRGLCLVRVRY